VSERWRGLPEEDAVRKLLGDAGPRPALPEEDLAAIRDAARAEWARRYGAAPERQSPRRSWLPLAAALLAGVIGLAWWARTRPSVRPPTVASIERVSGGAGREVGSPLAAGSMLATDGETPGRLTLRMRGGASLRLDVTTQVRLESATMVELLRGAVYVDTGAAPGRAEEIAVRAGNGLFHPAGTQFQVRVEGRDTKLRVREGRVAMDRRDGSVVAGAGEELIVRGDGGVVRRTVALSGPEWDWVGETAPMLAIEGVKVREFLKWIGRETGLRVEFADGEAEAVADSCVLHGSIEQLSLADAPRVVLSSCGLGHRVSNGTLVVFVAGKKGG
jgi:ferric-dicitrate binding protein FerR (iron transport regulator)